MISYSSYSIIAVKYQMSMHKGMANKPERSNENILPIICTDHRIHQRRPKSLEQPDPA
ncbi:hypothetical protein LLH06_10915 [Mucilaginibacter daejeonensis]|uniref:hypothetical protein n=1 Tax=Mucilaginibacter daejeonensis TaxID=398049 RepID=UPI001D176FAE|nr:hypothetical protein [Mucilaginibacter daejeonensis]UEG51484.1 hypothetical protein LLH06_10915 [Mucilaginibacter daejeonensis]